MSYKEQELETPIQQILEGFKKFNENATQRAVSNEWETEHILKLNRIRKKLFYLQLELEEVSSEKIKFKHE